MRSRAAERSLELANARYQEGYADFQRVIDAQRALFAQAEQQLINHSDYISAVIELYKSLGGGWIDMSVEQMLPESVRDEMQESNELGRPAGRARAGRHWPVEDIGQTPMSDKPKRGRRGR